MLGVKVPIKKAEKIKKFLLNNNLMDREKIPSKNKHFLYFPVKKKFVKTDVEFVDREFKEKTEKENWKYILSKELTKKELYFLKTAHDVVGSIAILEIPEELKKKEKLIAETLLKENKNIKTVLKKADDHSGIFRTQKMKWLAGNKTKETIHKENNIRLKVNVEKMYFSVRLSTERKRILKLVKKGEKILVMFSGCAPYLCVLSKNSEAKKVIGVELNPEGHKYALENIKLNKLSNAELFLGDVKKVVPQIKEKFDRICMPLPKSAENFLKEALMVAKKGTIIHFYDFLHETEFDKAEDEVNNICKKVGVKYKVLNFVKCGQYSPGKFRVCLDFKIL